jgi:hypothetical protein
MDESINGLVNTITELLININDRIVDISKKYRDENIFEEDRVVNLLDDLNVLTEGISVIEKNYNTIKLSELQDKLCSMIESLEVKDYSLFIDLMQYDLGDLLSYWKGILTTA